MKEEYLAFEGLDEILNKIILDNLEALLGLVSRVGEE
jgi:hypothetical protein